MEVASLMAFRLHPRRFYKWFHELAATLLAAEPNSAHLALAELELAGAMIGIVTQNIDGLHQRAGSVRVAEIHGHIRQATCMGCFHHQSTEGLLHAFVETGDPPRCEQCGGYLKPDVILFGEQLPFEQVAAARQLFSDVDFVLVGGSSLEVSPVSNLPFSALNAGARLVIVNLQPTYLDQRADVLIRADVAEVIPVLASKVLHAH